MPNKKRTRRGGKPGALISLLLGFACAAVLSVIFYGAMVYQLSDEGSRSQRKPALPTPAPLAAEQSAAQLFPGPLLGLSGAELTEETAQDVKMGMEICRVVTRTYTFESGANAQLVSAYPTAYLSRLSQEGWQAQLVSGFALAGVDAAYMLRGEQGMLAAKDGGCVYLLIAAADEAQLYALGASAYLEGQADFTRSVKKKRAKQPPSGGNRPEGG